jgi:hypothetical protein
MPPMFQRRLQKLNDRGPLAVAEPKLPDAGSHRRQGKRRLRVSAARQEIVEQIGDVLDRLSLGQRQHESFQIWSRERR